MNNNELAIIAAFYLSKFDRDGIHNLGYVNESDAFTRWCRFSIGDSTIIPLPYQLFLPGLHTTYFLPRDGSILSLQVSTGCTRAFFFS